MLFFRCASKSTLLPEALPSSGGPKKPPSIHSPHLFPAGAYSLVLSSQLFATEIQKEQS